MYLSPYALNNFSEQVADAAISFNPDIFESNLINISILVGGLIYLLSDILSEGLAGRKQEILFTIQDAETRLAQATARLDEVEKQLAQAEMVVTSLVADAQKNGEKIRSAILVDGQAETERLQSSIQSQVKTIEARVRKQVLDYAVNLALERVTLQLEGELPSSVQQSIIDKNISKL